MEPNDDATIRRKVHGLESEPVVLDKERLWSSIAFPAARREPRYLIYYAAASVALAWALVFLFQELSRRDELQVRLRELELQIQTQSTLVSFTASVAPAEVPCELTTTEEPVASTKQDIPRQPKAIQRSRVPGSRLQVSSVTTPVVAEVQEATNSASSETPIIEESAQKPELVVASTQPEARPRVVLGTVLPNRVSSTQGQRLRFGLFREEERPTSPGTPLISLAGVNNQ